MENSKSTERKYERMFRRNVQNAGRPLLDYASRNPAWDGMPSDNNGVENFFKPLMVHGEKTYAKAIPQEREDVDGKPYIDPNHHALFSLFARKALIEGNLFGKVYTRDEIALGLEKEFFRQMTVLANEIFLPLWTFSRIDLRKKQYREKDGVNGKHFITLRSTDSPNPKGNSKAEYYRERWYLKNKEDPGKKEVAMPMSTSIDSQGILKRLWVFSKTFSSNPSLGALFLADMAHHKFEISADQMGLGFVQLLYQLNLHNNSEYSTLMDIGLSMMQSGMGEADSSSLAERLIDKYGKYTALLDPQVIKKLNDIEAENKIHTEKSQGSLDIHDYIGEQIVSETERSSISYQEDRLRAAIVKLPEYRTFPIIFRFVKRLSRNSKDENSLAVASDIKERDQIESSVRVNSRNIASVLKRIEAKFILTFNKPSEEVITNATDIENAKKKSITFLLEIADSIGITSPKMKRAMSLLEHNGNMLGNTHYEMTLRDFLNSESLKPFMDSTFFDFISSPDNENQVGLFVKSVLARFSRDVLNDKNLETVILASTFSLKPEELEKLIMLKSIWHRLPEGEDIKDALARTKGDDYLKIYQDRDQAYMEIAGEKRMDLFKRELNLKAKNALDRERPFEQRPYIRRQLLMVSGVIIGIAMGLNTLADYIFPQVFPPSEPITAQTNNPSKQIELKQGKSIEDQLNIRDILDNIRVVGVVVALANLFYLKHVKYLPKSKENEQEYEKTMALSKRVGEFSNYLKYFFTSTERGSGYTNENFLIDLGLVLDKESENFIDGLHRIPFKEDVEVSKEVEKLSIFGLNKQSLVYLSSLLSSDKEDLIGKLDLFPSIQKAFSKDGFEGLNEVPNLEMRRFVACLNIMSLKRNYSLRINVINSIMGNRKDSEDGREKPTLDLQAYEYVYSLLNTDIKSPELKMDGNIRAIKKLLISLQNMMIGQEPLKEKVPDPILSYYVLDFFMGGTEQMRYIRSK